MGFSGLNIEMTEDPMFLFTGQKLEIKGDRLKACSREVGCLLFAGVHGSGKLIITCHAFDLNSHSETRKNEMFHVHDLFTCCYELYFF